ncbi:MAG: pseudouridine synthase [bacterium]
MKKTVHQNKNISQVKTTFRINKYMADMGLASRREADELIATGVVFVNDEKAQSGMQIDPSKDKLEVRADKKTFVYYAYNKPVGIVTTGAQGNEEDILSYTKFPHKVFPLGRLDKDSHGLILLTNDRRITHRLLDPQFEHEKEYIVEVEKNINKNFLRTMESGIKINGAQTKPIQIFQIDNTTFNIILTEGKNRQIRKMVEVSGDHVVDLERVRIEHIELDGLKEGTFRPISKTEISKLLKKLGLS